MYLSETSLLSRVLPTHLSFLTHLLAHQLLVSHFPWIIFSLSSLPPCSFPAHLSSLTKSLYPPRLSLLSHLSLSCHLSMLSSLWLPSHFSLFHHLFHLVSFLTSYLSVFPHLSLSLTHYTGSSRCFLIIYVSLSLSLISHGVVISQWNLISQLPVPWEITHTHSGRIQMSKVLSFKQKVTLGIWIFCP